MKFTSIKSLLFSEQGLNRRQVSSEFLAFNMGFLQQTIKQFISKSS